MSGLIDSLIDYWPIDAVCMRVCLFEFSFYRCCREAPDGIRPARIASGDQRHCSNSGRKIDALRVRDRSFNSSLFCVSSLLSARQAQMEGHRAVPSSRSKNIASSFGLG